MLITRLFFSGDIWFSLVSLILRFEPRSEGVLFCLLPRRIILKVLSSVASCEVFFLSCVCWTKFTAAVFDLGVTSRFIKIHCKKGPTSDVATAFWNLLIFYDDMVFNSMVGFPLHG
jgi:hypothetical protein